VGGTELQGEILDKRYEIVARLAEGAMGVVYRGVRLKLDRAVAIKVMHHALPDASAARKRFEREARLMARLEHPHCVSIVDFGVHKGKPYVVMQLVSGRDLFDVLADQRRFDPQRAADVMCQVLSGLAHAHEQNIIHRDIKPANIMITPKAPLGVHARILDFGLASMLGSSINTSKGLAVGSPSYMAPEQCRGAELDARVDIYACGVVLFEMLTGRKPFIADEPIAIMKKHLEEPPPRLADVTPGDYGTLEAVVARALAKAPQDRYPSAVAMAEALAAAVAPRVGPDTTARLSAASTREMPVVGGEPPARRSSLRWWLLAIAALGAAAVFAWPVIERELAGEDEPVRDAVVLVVRSPIDAALDATTPDATTPDATTPDATTPDATTPDATTPDATTPDATTPDATTPDAAELVDTPPPPSPADAIVAKAKQLAADGKVSAALDQLRHARQIYPESAQLPLLAGKLAMSQLYFTEGITSFRAAIKLDPALRTDPELVHAAVHAFTITPSVEPALARFVTELGEAAWPALDEIAKSHPNLAIRARAARLRGQ
jgi:eukaryotic-like serine/threonine-protein kinase